MGSLRIKRQVSLTIDKNIHEKAQLVAKKKGTSISQIVEKFLDFYSNPVVYCFKCGKNFSAEESELCPKCGWMKCPSCSICRCALSDDVATAVFYMREVYEGLLTGSVKQA